MLRVSYWLKLKAKVIIMFVLRASKKENLQDGKKQNFRWPLSRHLLKVLLGENESELNEQVVERV